MSLRRFRRELAFDHVFDFSSNALTGRPNNACK